ncbi:MULTISPECIES: hypothetical protein [Streptomyces]|uniref:hypothetical protein n=1 Tax=Streptomyces TaxID=1883 RepID=UPI00081BA7CB|nr:MULTISPECIES: hypothetical protein [Streptomyces]MYX86811.1 hypothetical protein [Streptomyces sp. SID4915]RZE50712.1 hypothetical protein C0Q98_31750 [Streptomyces albidoflavus]SCD92906.1 hypothetical protein GA0115250_12928 [Streptomyces sp. BvitLS-983]
MTLTDAEIKTRMAAAEGAEARGSYREAAHLYNRLAQDVQASHGRCHPLAIDAHESVARAVRKTGK